MSSSRDLPEEKKQEIERYCQDQGKSYKWAASLFGLGAVAFAFAEPIAALSCATVASGAALMDHNQYEKCMNEEIKKNKMK